MSIALQHTATALDFSGSTVSSLGASAFSLGTGNLVFVDVRWGVDSAPTLSITDTAGNSYTLIDSHWDSVATQGCATFYAKNTTANASNVVTANFTGGSQKYVMVVAAEYSGLSTTSPLDQHAITDSSGASNQTIASGSFTTTSASEVLISVGFTSGGNGADFTADTGYTVEAQLIDTGQRYGALQDKIVSSIQTGVTATLRSEERRV